jgi:hypothetical protein
MVIKSMQRPDTPIFASSFLAHSSQNCPLDGYKFATPVGFDLASHAAIYAVCNGQWAGRFSDHLGLMRRHCPAHLHIRKEAKLTNWFCQGQFHAEVAAAMLTTGEARLPVPLLNLLVSLDQAQTFSGEMSSKASPPAQGKQSQNTAIQGAK